MKPKRHPCVSTVKPADRQAQPMLAAWLPMMVRHGTTSRRVEAAHSTTPHRSKDC
jgi:hypothetical protein